MGMRIRALVTSCTVLCLLATPVAEAQTKVQAQVAAARKMLKQIPSATPSNLEYDREGQFGEAWVDVDANGCDTRNDILKRDLTAEAFRDDCIIETGLLKDRYSGKTINFERGVSTSLAVQIDHVIPLHYAWMFGAADWRQGKRVAFANDPVNLIAVDGPTNSRKSDSGPGEWLPPMSGYQCTYSIRFIRIAFLYQVKIAATDRSALKAELSSCKKVFGTPATMTPLSPAVWPRAEQLG